MNKVKKTHKFFNVVVDDDLLKDIRDLREAGVNWQALTRSFLQGNVRSRKPTNEGGRSARPKPRTRGEVSLRDHPFHHCCPICTCDGLCWRGRNLGWSDAWAVASSPTRMTW